jgi:hypothetical protein
MEVEMKMVKSLLLGTAAGLVAVAGAQAADMPVKAKPVQFVKICTLYGDGFYYVPGTDTCLKLGGYVRVQVEAHAGAGGVVDGTLSQVPQAFYNRVQTNDIDYRVRGALSLDVRDQTEYGTLRSYFRIGVNQTTPVDGIGGVVFWDRAFIQWAGFTVGKAQSFFDTVTYGGAYSTTTCARYLIPVPPAGTCGPTPPSSATAGLPPCRWKIPTASARSSMSRRPRGLA